MNIFLVAKIAVACLYLHKQFTASSPQAVDGSTQDTVELGIWYIMS